MGAALRRGRSLKMQGGGDPGWPERRRVVSAEKEERAPEAWAREQTAGSFWSLLFAVSGARDEYRPAGIVICFRLNIFSLKRRWGVLEEGCEVLRTGALYLAVYPRGALLF